MRLFTSANLFCVLKVLFVCFAYVSAFCTLDSLSLVPKKVLEVSSHQPFHKKCLKKSFFHVTGYKTKFLPRATLRLPSFEFDNSDCVSDLHSNDEASLELFRNLNGRRIWWYGDSLVLLYFMTFVCRAELVFENVSELHVETSQNCRSNIAFGFLARSKNVSFEMYYFKTQTKLLYTRRTRRKTAPNCLTYELFRDIQPSASDLFLLNIGAWFNFNTPTRNMVVLENEIRLFFNYFRNNTTKQFKAPAFIWLESTAQHFPGRANGNFNYLTHKDGKQKCTDQKSYKPIRPSPQVHEFEPLRVGLVPLFNLTAKVGARAHSGAPRGDCTHFALYHGGVLDRRISTNS
ncbi:hypothetical protein RI054_16g77060 [Pseudoscourfieldia marina]